MYMNKTRKKYENRMSPEKLPRMLNTMTPKGRINPRIPMKRLMDS